jgi:S-adenosylmethionine:tRNA ribosyltransferase-isomerase
MRTSDFYYELPQELIAQDPLEDRSSSRLMHLSMADGSIEHRHFRDILDYLNEGDTLVINDTKVIPARLYGHKEETGAVIEILLLKRRENDIWECLVKPGKKARPGAKITFGDGILEGEIIDVVDEGNRLIQFHYEGIFEEILDQLGEMPLPPYITHKLKDKNRYQTVYAKNEGSAAAPTAGLHFTKELLEQVKAKGVNIAHVTLHVGLGTDVAGGFSLSMFRAIADAIQVSKLRWRLMDQTQAPVTLEEAFYMATIGGGSFFGKVGSFEKGYEFDAMILDDSNIRHPQEISTRDRLERLVYLSDDRNLVGKYVQGRKVI